jgi:peroxiredoxin
VSDYRALPPDLPVPVDDGAADHLPGLEVPRVKLPATTGGRVDLAAAASEPGRLVVYVYPRTGTPGEPLPPGWDDVPGARGCTPESCAFRDARDDFAALGARLMGLSAQSPADQREFAERERIPYPLLSDSGLALARTGLRLPTLEARGLLVYKRLTLVLRAGRVEHAFYPVFPPDRHAGDVLAWLAAHPTG